MQLGLEMQQQPGDVAGGCQQTARRVARPQQSRRSWHDNSDNSKQKNPDTGTFIGRSRGTSKLLKETGSVITRQEEYSYMVAVPPTGRTYHTTTQLIHALYPGWDKSNMPNVMFIVRLASEIS